MLILKIIYLNFLCFYLQNLATLVKREYRREMGYLYMVEKKTFLVFCHTVFLKLLYNWNGVYFHSHRESIPG